LDFGLPQRNVADHDPDTTRPILPDRAASPDGHGPPVKKMVMDDPLPPDSDPGLDATVLPALLARLDPAVATDLRRQFATDLRSLHQALVAALGPPPDMLALARHAHGLVALAGTAGAAAVAARARLLLRAVHRGEADTSARLARALLPCIDALVAFVADCPLPDRAVH